MKEKITLVSLRRQEVQLHQQGQPIIFPKGVIITAIDEGLVPFKGLATTLTFKQIFDEKVIPHYIFDGKVFHRNISTNEILEKVTEVSKQKLCMYGCNQPAKYPEHKPVRCAKYWQQCPAMKKKLSETLKKKILDARTKKDLPEKKSIEEKQSQLDEVKPVVVKRPVESSSESVTIEPTNKIEIKTEKESTDKTSLITVNKTKVNEIDLVELNSSTIPIDRDEEMVNNND